MLTLDWLSFVVSDDRQEILDYLSTRLSEALGVEFQSCSGLHGYESSRRSEGCVISFGGENQNNTVLVSLSGVAANVLGWYGSAALVRAVIKRFFVNVKFSRIDLALDVPGEWWQKFNSPSMVYARIKDERIKGVVIVNDYERQKDESERMAIDCWKSACKMAARKIGSPNYIVTGHTTYIGSRTSERFMRIYKKTKDDGLKVTRFEYELKQRYATVVGSMMLTGETIGAAYIFANTNHIDISDIYDVTELYEPPCASLPRKKERDTLLWFMRICGAIVTFMEANQEQWNDIIRMGQEKIAPVGNTGVHIPKWLEDIDQQALNLETFGIPYHPIMGLQN